MPRKPRVERASPLVDDALPGSGGTTRRRVLALAGGGAAVAVLRAEDGRAQGAQPSRPPGPLGDGQRFTATAVIELARAAARRPFTAPPNDVPEPYAGLNSERYNAIKASPAGRVWAGEGRGFVVEPLLRGFVFTAAVSLFLVEDGEVRRVAFDRGRFELDGLNLPPNAAEPGFSGFRLEAAAAGGAPFEFAIVQGATFFRALARGQNFGTVARALMLKPADQRGEEFPFFRAFWIERPLPGTNALVVHALLDSESVSGAVRMTFRPGEVTIVDVETTLFPRVALDHVGIGGMAATFLFGPNVKRIGDELRPAVYDAGGLQILNGQGEWLWRPLNNPDTLQISAFLDRGPKGFGLLQRERDFALFQDDAQRFEGRPSVWIEPIGDWGEGAVQLIEIPSDSELNDNVLAYWRPKAPLAAGGEATVAYRQFWCWTPPDRPGLATVTTTRSGRGGGKRRRFVVEFAGPALASAFPDMKPVLTASPGQIQNMRVWTYPERSSARVVFELEPGNDTAIEMRLVLQAAGRPVSETWLYRWTT